MILKRRLRIVFDSPHKGKHESAVQRGRPILYSKGGPSSRFPQGEGSAKRPEPLGWNRAVNTVTMGSPSRVVMTLSKP